MQQSAQQCGAPLSLIVALQGCLGLMPQFLGDDRVKTTRADNGTFSGQQSGITGVVQYRADPIDSPQSALHCPDFALIKPLDTGKNGITVEYFSIQFPDSGCLVCKDGNPVGLKPKWPRATVNR